MRTPAVLLAALLIVAAGSATPGAATVLCKKKSGAVFVRNACKPKETRLDPDALGLRVSQGAKGDKGDPGQRVQGPTGAAGPALVVKDSNGAFVGLVTENGGTDIVRRINGQHLHFTVRDTGFPTQDGGPG